MLLVLSSFCTYAGIITGMCVDIIFFFVVVDVAVLADGSFMFLTLFSHFYQQIIAALDVN